MSIRRRIVAKLAPERWPAEVWKDDFASLSSAITTKPIKKTATPDEIKEKIKKRLAGRSNLVGYKGKSSGDLAAFYCPYVTLSTFGTITTASNKISEFNVDDKFLELNPKVKIYYDVYGKEDKK